MNDFWRDVEYSIELNYSDQFDEFYRAFFKTVKEIKPVTDLKLQKQGIDKIVVLESGKEIFVDEKKRRQDYGDILLEEYSSFEAQTPGWLSRDKFTDYVAYAIVPSNKLYFLPFWILRRAFRKNYTAWLKKYGRKKAKNKGYETSNIPVPVPVVMEAMKKIMLNER